MGTAWWQWLVIFRDCVPKPKDLINVFAVGENPGCFGASKKKKDGTPVTDQRNPVSGSRGTLNRGETTKGMDLLWQPEVNIFTFLPSVL